MKLSVIVPIYNAASSIERCVRSLMGQTMPDDVEFLFVDDASTDDSLCRLRKVLQDYPERISQVRIFPFPDHQGVAEMRTVGMKAAKGEYIGWCDADDWVEPNMFQTMIDAADSSMADIVVCSYYDHSPEKIDQQRRYYHSNPREHIRLLYEQPDTTLFLWDKILRRSILTENQILPEQGIDLGEDRSILVKMFCRSGRLISVEQGLYHHTIGQPVSLTSNDKSSRYRFEQDCANTDAVCAFLEKEDAEAYFRTCQYIRFLTKQGYDRLLGKTRAYYDLYRSSHSGIMYFSAIPYTMRKKLSIIFSSYWAYRSYCAYSYIKKKLL